MNITQINHTFSLGDTFTINRIGYGAMRLTGQPGNFGPYADWEQGKLLLQEAVAQGVTFFDTAEAYGPDWNEKIIQDALYPYAKNVIIGTKGGIRKTSPSDIQADGRPKMLRAGVEKSLQQLKLDSLPLYQWHRPDPSVPFEQSIETLAALQQEGKINLIGLSNVNLNQLKAAQQIVPIASVQNRYNVMERQHEEVLNYAEQHGIALIAYAPLAAHPMKQGSPFEKAEGTLAEIAAHHQATSMQIAMRWLLHRSPNIVLIPGTTSLEHLRDNMRVVDIALTDEEVDQINHL